MKYPNDQISYSGDDILGLEIERKQDNQIKKMGPVKTLFAILKAYCAINVLLLPRAFANGGYLLSPIAMMSACFFEALCAARLTQVAHQYQIFSYPLLMKRALGDKGLYVGRICLALAHW